MRVKDLAALFIRRLSGAHGVDGGLDLLRRAAEPLAALLPNTVDAEYTMHVARRVARRGR